MGNTLLQELKHALAGQGCTIDMIECIVDKYDTTHTETDAVNHPPHYTNHPSGVECIDITSHMNFCLGNAVKYIWRADLKSDAREDLNKAIFYIRKELQLREDIQ